ncbi:hypothetical protein ACLVWU_04305 [Bdellovibrio sp. HCB290]|uniref:hypothetical protein n=1 Tax=Bdellovibrio sp. HCB290 TaxID=3394356 RepID=UPI0039B49F20
MDSLLKSFLKCALPLIGLCGCTLELSVQNFGSGSSLGPVSISVVGALEVSGVQYTDDVSPALSFTVLTMAPIEMKITNNADCMGGSWGGYAATVGAHSLTAGDGVKDVSVQFRDSAGITTSCVSTQLTLDTSVPTGESIAITADYVDAGSVKFVKNATAAFTLAATDPTLHQMKISNSGNCSTGSYEDFAVNKNWALAAGDGVKDVSVKFRDRFSHESSCVSLSAVLDSTASAVPAIELAEGAEGVGTMTYSPKVHIKNAAANEAADAAHSGFLDYQGQVVRVSDSQVMQAWTSLGTGSLLQATGLNLVDGVNYRLEVRTRDKAGNTSTAVAVTWTASVVPQYLASIENATSTTEYESSTFTIGGSVTAVTVTATNGAKICLVPCADWTAAGASLNANSGDVFSLKMTSLASGTRTSILTIGAYSTTWKISTSVLCPLNYVLVPGENGTLQNEFCIAKYEMKILGDDDGYQTYNPALVADSRPTGTAWRQITMPQMLNRCQALGAGYDLVSNLQWNVIARNIAGVASNWNGNAVGSGQLNQGNRSSGDQEPADADDNYACANLPSFTYPGATATCSDSVWNNLKRTHKLSNGSVLWDFSGGAWEGVKYTYADTFTGTNDLVANIADGTYFKSLMGALGITCLTPGGGNEYCGFGKAWINDARPASALFRGGSASNGQQAGVFATDFDYDTSYADGGHSFRCVSPLIN